MMLLFLSALAWGGVIQVVAQVPAEVRLDGLPVLQAFVPLEASVSANDGVHRLEVVVGGVAQERTVEVREARPTLLLIGALGVSVEAVTAPESAAKGMISLECRVVGDEELLLVLGGTRYRFLPGQTQVFSLLPGQHPLEVRSPDGTLIWARGSLHLAGGGPVVLQLSGGQTPDVAGGESRFSSANP